MSDTAETPAPPAAPATSPMPVKPPHPLTRPTDAAPRPGFRAPSNTGSKAQKKKR